MEHYGWGLITRINKYMIPTKYRSNTDWKNRTIKMRQLALFSIFLQKNLHMCVFFCTFVADLIKERAMSKKWLNGINAILGALSVGLLGCRTSHECLYGPPPQPDKYGCPPEEIIMAKYGPPSMWGGDDSVPEPVPAPTIKQEDKKETNE